MDKEFKRMIELAGLNEIKINPPGGNYSLINIYDDSDNPILKGNKRQILDYIINNVTIENIGYKMLHDGSIVDYWDNEHAFNNIEDLKNRIWDQMINNDPLGGDFIVKKLGS